MTLAKNVIADTGQFERSIWTGPRLDQDTGFEIHFVTKGSKAAICFRLHTGWVSPEFQLPVKPSPVAVKIHWRWPMDGRQAVEKCALFDSQPCWVQDTSPSTPYRVFRELTEEGMEPMYKVLEDIYRDALIDQ